MRPDPHPHHQTEELRKREALIAEHAAGEPEEQPDDDLLAARDLLMDQLEELPVPPSPLDALIDALGGPLQVAEMTGRRGRLVREGDVFTYQLRDAHHHKGGAGASAAAREEAIDSINIQERAAFMAGRKLVAILSDAGRGVWYDGCLSGVIHLRAYHPTHIHSHFDSLHRHLPARLPPAVLHQPPPPRAHHARARLLRRQDAPAAGPVRQKT